MPPIWRCSRSRRAPTRGAPAAPPPRTESRARPPRARQAIRSRCHPPSRRFEACVLAELLVRSTALEARERLAGLPVVEPAADQAFDRPLELRARHAAEERAADLRRGPERAAHEDVVGADAVAVGVLAGGRLEAEVADPVLRAGMRTAVEVQPQLGDLVAERPLEMLEQPA